MREIEIKTQFNGNTPIKSELTLQSNPSTLDVRGNIFMPEPGQGEGTPIKSQPSHSEKAPQPTVGPGFEKIPLPPQPGQPASQERIEFARKEWEKFNLGKETKPKEIEQQKEYIEKGVTPAMGGSPAATSQEYLERLTNIRDTITNSEFRAIIEQIISNPEIIPVHYEALSDRHKELYNELLKKIGEVPTGLEGEVERLALSAELGRLETEFNLVRRSVVAGIPERERGLEEVDREELEDIESTPQGEEKNKKIRSFMKKYIKKVSPEDESISDRIMRVIAEDEVATEEFISRLIVSYIENEPWSIKGFYGNINFEKFTRVTRNIITGERRDHLLSLIDANSAFHNMNYILKRNFEQFSQQSEAILPQHLEVVSSLPGVDDALTLYEEITAEVLGEETMITEDLAQQITERVEGEITERATNIKGMAGEELEDWEINRALIYARNFFRISVRFAEQTALSELPREDDPSLYVSSPQKQLTQVLNVLKFIGVRFKIEEPLGGPELLKNALAHMAKERKDDRKVRLKILQGTSVDMRETQGIIGARGVFATWRNAEIALRQLVFEDANGKATNAVQFFLDHKEQIGVLAERSKNKKLSETDRKRLKNDVKQLFNPLLEKTSIHLGLLASPSGLSGVTSEFKELIWEKIIDLNPAFVASLLTRLETDDPKLQFVQGREIKPKLDALEDILLRVWGTDEQRKMIWGNNNLKWRDDKELMRIKMENFEILGMREIKRVLAIKSEQLHTLTATQESSRNEPQRQRINQISLELDTLRSLYGEKDNVLKELFRDNKWQGMLRKLRIANKMRVNEESDRLKNSERIKEAPRSIQDFLKSDYGLELNVAEAQVLSEITYNGKEIAPDLTRIKQSTAWFLDDISFKNLEWVRLGQFYDRETGDLANFNKGAGGLLKILSNPFGVSADDILTDFQEAISGASQVIGRQAAQDNQFPIFNSWAEMIHEKPIFRQLFIELAMHTLKKPTSRAQEIVGMEGLAVNEDGMQAIFDKALPLGVLRKEVKDEKGKVKWDGTYEKARKKFRTLWYNIAWGKIRDFGPIGLVAFLIQFFQSLTKEKLN